jgi:hypothetical protein
MQKAKRLERERLKYAVELKVGSARPSARPNRRLVSTGVTTARRML